MHATRSALFLEKHAVNAVKAPALLCPKGQEGTQLHKIQAMLSYFTAQLRPAAFSWCDDVCFKASTRSYFKNIKYITVKSVVLPSMN